MTVSRSGASSPASIPAIRDRGGASAREGAPGALLAAPAARTQTPGVPAAGVREGLGGLVAVLLAAAGADAASVGRQCRRACTDEIASCVAAGGRRLTCTRQTLMR